MPKNQRKILAPLVLLLYISSPRAETPDWEVVINFPMAWLPDISGEISVAGDSTDVEIPIGDLLDHAEAGFIGEIYVQRGRWGLAWRSMLLQTESSSRTEPVTGLPGRPPIIGQHRIRVENELYTSDLLGSFALSDRFALYTGIRRTGNKTRVKIRPLEPGLVEIDRRVTVLDARLEDWVVGGSLHYPFASNWAVEVQGDIGVAGDNDRNQQLNAFLSYAFNQRHGIWFGYRYLRIMDSNRGDEGERIRNDFTQQGPTLGWAWSF
jgi:hypothetical protein